MSTRPIPRATREAVYERDGYSCQRCGRGCVPGSHSIQHRLPKGRGGTSLDPNTMANLVLLCGSATSPDCHHHVESYRTESYDHGWLVRRGHDPAEAPILRFGRSWWLLTDDGWQRCPATGDLQDLGARP